MKRLLVLSGAILLAAACGSDGETQDPNPKPMPIDPIDDDWQSHGPDGKGDATLNPVLDGRVGKRLTVDQLRRVFPQLTNGQTWHQDLPFGTEQFLLPMFDYMGPSLGEANYDTTTVNFLDPIPSFMKYVDEAASQVCTWAVLEPGNPTIAPFGMEEANVDDNLRFLKLKFHGIYVPDGSTEGIADLRTFYDDLYAQYFDHPNAAYQLVPWIGVCIAVMTDPEFYIY